MARLTLLSIVLVALAACGGGSGDSTSGTGGSETSTSAPTTSNASSSTTSIAPTTTTPEADDGVLLGAYVEPRGEFGDAARREAVLAHEASIGRPLALVNEFFAFDKPWNTDRLAWHVDSGRGLMISWNGTHADDILSGSVDDTIRDRARATRDLDVPLLLRFFWEPDAAKGRTWGYHDDPRRYHEVWRHVRAIFAEEGADNARWVWTPTTWHFTTGNAPAFYPGDDVVDLIGADGYLWSPCQGPAESTDARTVFGDFLEWARSRPQPIVIAEWGADADAGTGTKADFIADMRALSGEIDDLFALVLFDAVDPGGRGCDWRVDSSQDALDAYRALASDPLFAGSAGRIGAL